MGDQIKCPCCGSFMDRGHLTAGGYRIIWTPKNWRLSAIKGPGDILVERLRLSGGVENIAWHCRSCGRILVERPQNPKDI